MKFMLMFSHIPKKDFQPEFKNRFRQTESIRESIEDIISRWANWDLSLSDSQKYWIFYSQAMDLLFPLKDSKDGGDIDNDSKDGGYIDEDNYVPRYKILENLKKLTELYISLCICDEALIQKALQIQWNEANELGDTRIVIWDKYFYVIFQSVHWDVTITQYPLMDKVQGELFEKDWYTVGEVKGVTISCYQETLWLVAALIRGYSLSWLEIWSLEKILNELGTYSARTVFAADSWTKDDQIDFYKHILERESTHPKYFWVPILSHPPNDRYYSAYNSNLEEFELWSIEKHDKIVEAKVLWIPSIDIPKILKELCILSWRSWDWPRILIWEYIRTKT